MRRWRKEKRSLWGRNSRRPRCAVKAQPASGELRLPQRLQEQEARSVRTLPRQPAEAGTPRRQQQPSDGRGRGEAKGEAAADGGGAENGWSRM